MTMITYTLTSGVWYELEDLDDHLLAIFTIDGTGPCIGAVDVTTPGSSDPGYILFEGINQFVIPPGRQAYVKLLSGSADIIYSQFSGILMDPTKCAYARSDGVAVDDLFTDVDPQVGKDDSPTDELDYVGYLHTVAANIANAATITTAILTLALSAFRVGRTVRVYGVDSATSQFGTLTDYASLASGLSLTTAFTDVDIDGTGILNVDVDAILTELVALGGWGTSSPVQFWLGDPDAATAGVDATCVIDRNSRLTALLVT